MGRCIVEFSPGEFMDLLRGAKLVVYARSDWTFSDPLPPPTPAPVDLFGLRVVHVQHDHGSDSIWVTLSGPGLPDWRPGSVPDHCQMGLSRWAEEPAPYRTRRQFDMEET